MVKVTELEELDIPYQEDSGIIPESWYEYFGKEPIPDSLEEDIGFTTEDLEFDPDRLVEGLTAEGDPIFEDQVVNPEWWGQDIGEFLPDIDELMTESIFPGIDKSYEALKDLDLSDLDDVDLDQLQNLAATGSSAIGNIPERLGKYMAAGPASVYEGLTTEGGPLKKLKAALSWLPKAMWDVGEAPIDYADNSWFHRNVLEPITGIYATRKGAEFAYDKLPSKIRNLIRHGFPWGHSRIADYPTEFKSLGALEEHNKKLANRGFFRKTIGELLNTQRGSGIMPRGGLNPLKSPMFRGIGQGGILGTAFAAMAPYFATKANELLGTPRYPEGHDRAGDIIYSTRDYEDIHGSQGDTGGGYAAGQMPTPVSREVRAPSNRAMMEMANTRGPGPRDDYRGL